MSLKDAVSAINAKIQVAAGGASAEELAYLATAVERIGGRASIFEIDELATSQKQIMLDGFDAARAAALSELTLNKTNSLTAIDSVTNLAVTAIAADRLAAENKIAADRLAAETSLNNLRIIGQDAITTDSAEAQAEIGVDRALAISEISSATTSSLAQITASAEQVTQQLFGQPGRLMFYSTF